MRKVEPLHTQDCEAGYALQPNKALRLPAKRCLSTRWSGCFQDYYYYHYLFNVNAIHTLIEMASQSESRNLKYT